MPVLTCSWLLWASSGQFFDVCAVVDSLALPLLALALLWAVSGTVLGFSRPSLGSDWRPRLASVPMIATESRREHTLKSMQIRPRPTSGYKSAQLQAFGTAPARGTLDLWWSAFGRSWPFQARFRQLWASSGPRLSALGIFRPELASSGPLPALFLPILACLACMSQHWTFRPALGRSGSTIWVIICIFAQCLKVQNVRHSEHKTTTSVNDAPRVA